MSDFSFLQNVISKKWIIRAPKRAKRPDVAKGTEPACPFCPGREGQEEELYRRGGEKGDSNWSVRVIPNKFPFTQNHELVLNSPDHHADFTSFPQEQILSIFQVYRERYNEHAHKGQVYIFHNHGLKAGESIPHSHTQIAVVPDKVLLEIPRLQSVSADIEKGIALTHFTLFCPTVSQWPDEVWVAPKKTGRVFGELQDDEASELADLFSRLVKIMDARHGEEFPFNFYIYPGGDWYLRFIPREKTLGGFEVGTGVFVNTQDPSETLSFLKDHFNDPDFTKIRTEHQAAYHRSV